MDYNKWAIEIDNYLRSKGITRILKRELMAIFSIRPEYAPTIWSAMKPFGWRVSWSVLELPPSVQGLKPTETHKNS